MNNDEIEELSSWEGPPNTLFFQREQNFQIPLQKNNILIRIRPISEKIQNLLVENSYSMGYSFFTKTLLFQNNKNQENDLKRNSSVDIFLKHSHTHVNDLEREKFKQILENDCVPRKKIKLFNDFQFCFDYGYSPTSTR